MKSPFRNFLLAGLFSLSFSLIIDAQKNPDRPTGLMIEFIRQPANVPVMNLKPGFAWIVPEKAISQTAYQILIGSSYDKLGKEIADTWDSKKVTGNLSSGVLYGGMELTRKTRYYWKVRIWNNADQPSAFSDIQSFITGAPEGYNTTRNKFQETLIPPQKFVRIDNRHYFIDFGKDAFGTLVLDINSLQADSIIVHLGEKISGQNRIDRKPEGSIRYQKVVLAIKPGRKRYTLELPKDTRNTGSNAVHLPDSIGVITPFRYCELENCGYDLKPENIRQKAIWYFNDENMSSFTSSDTVLNKVWDICKYSIKATSFAGLYVDGDRERIPYEADAYINQLGHYYTDREYSLARLTNEYLINHPTWPTEWILHTVPMFYNDFMYTGNAESLKNYYQELKNKTLVYMASEDGLISSKNCTDEIMKSIGFTNTKERIRDIVDWPPSQKDTGWKLATSEGERDGYDMVEVNTVVNAFYYRGLIEMADIASRLGKKDDSDFFTNKASNVKKAINDKLLNKAKGIYRDGLSSDHSSLHANMTALAFNLVPKENRKSVVEFIKSRGMACSVYGAQYLLEGLYNAGEADYAFSLLTATNDRSWWNMIKTGSTITMEAWDMKYKPNSDWNHAWGAVPANIIPHYMWGIAPAEPGFSKAVIKPQLSSLKHSKITVPTIRGNIVAEFNDTGKSKEYMITLPANMECDFELQDTRNLSVLLDNKLIATSIRVLKLHHGINKIVLK